MGDLKNYRTTLLCHIELWASFQSHRWIQTWVTGRKRSIRVKIGDFLSPVTLKFDGWPWKTMGRLFYVVSSFVHLFIAIGEFKLKLQTGNPQFGSKYIVLCDLEMWWMTLKNNRAPLLYCFKLYAWFHSHQSIQTKVTVRKRSFRVKIGDFLYRETLKFYGWHWKTIGHLFYVVSSFVHYFVAIGEFKLELQSGNTRFESKSTISLAVWPWNLTDDLENNRAPLLSIIKLYASFHHHMWIQTGVTVRKRLRWVMTSVTLTFDLWPLPIAWTSLLSLVTTPENLVMIRWREHSQKCVTGRQTDRQTEGLNHS